MCITIYLDVTNINQNVKDVLNRGNGAVKPSAVHYCPAFTVTLGLAHALSRHERVCLKVVTYRMRVNDTSEQPGTAAHVITYSVWCRLIHVGHAGV